MRKREIEKRLRLYAAACQQITPREKETHIKELLQIVPMPRTRGTLWNFIWEQIGYLGRYCLIWQALWIALFGFLIQQGAPRFFRMGRGNETLVMISLLPPILVLLTVEEITKVYQRSMLEIEYATKYSLQGVVMTRMSVLCVVHSLILSVCILVFGARLDSGIGRLLVYGFTPMILVTGGLLKLMQHCQGELLRNAAVAVYAVAAIFAVIGNSGYFDCYRPDYFGIWCIVCIVGIALGIWQFVCLNKKLSDFEQID